MQEDPNTNTKTIYVNLHPSKKDKKNKEETEETEETKPINMRKVASLWEFSEEAMTNANQWRILCLLNANTDANTDSYANTNTSEDTEMIIQIRRQIQYKINGYKGQDIKKSLYDPALFINYDYVVSLLHQKSLRCFYCKEQTWLLYNAVREAKQWTLDRIDNSVGHNRGNVEIACLICNLRRRTMYHERYVFTKQLNLVKLNDCDDDEF